MDDAVFPQLSDPMASNLKAMKTPFVLIALALSIGIVIGVIMQSDSSPSELASRQVKSALPANSDTANPMDSDLFELNRLLQSEIKARQALEEKVDALSQQLAAFADIPKAQDTAQPDQTGATQATDAEADDEWFKEQALIDSGMSSSQANELKVFFEQQELQRLYLRDQSIRQGWDRQKYRDEIQALTDEEDALEESLGENAFDAYLYASGQSNRIAVSSVLATAPAGAAGIMPGDHILRYDNQRVYSGFELRQATTSGSDDESVAVEVEREGETIEFYLPRGPLGIRMNSVSVAP